MMSQMTSIINIRVVGWTKMALVMSTKATVTRKKGISIFSTYRGIMVKGKMTK